MVAVGYVGVADLVGTIKREFCGEFVNNACVDIAHSRVARIPLGGESQVRRELLFQGELATGAVGGGDDVAREIVPARGNACAVLPLFGDRGVKVISGVVATLTDREEKVVAEIERPTRRIVVPETPFDCGSEVEFTDGGRAEAVEVDADFDLTTDANDNAGCVGEEGSGGLGGAVQFTVDFAFVEDVSAGQVEDSFLGEHGARRKQSEQK